MRNSALKLKTLFLLIASCLCSLGVSAQTLHQAKVYTDSLLAHEQAEKAELAYERVLFFSPMSEKAPIYFLLGQCQMAQGKFSLAKQQFTNVMAMPSKDSIKIESFFQRTICSILEKDFMNALIELEKIHFPDGSSDEKRRILFKATCQYGLGQYDLAERLFLSLVNDNPQAKAELVAIFKDARFNQPNPSIAFLMSMLVPGSGQVYAGEWKKGANSFLINALFIALDIVVIRELSVLDGLVTAVPWSVRFYVGGWVNALQLSEKKMQENKDADFQKIMRVINDRR